MTREDYILSLITTNGYSVKSFSKHIDIPYSTIRSILNNGVGGAAVDNIIKICKGLGITVDTLNHCGNDEDIFLTPHEREVIIAYRSHPSVQIHVDKLLDVEAEPEEQKKRA